MQYQSGYGYGKQRVINWANVFIQLAWNSRLDPMDEYDFEGDWKRYIESNKYKIF